MREFGGEIRKRFQHAAGAVRALGEENRQRVFEGGVSVVVLTLVTVDPVEERGEVDELVTRIDELEIKEFLLTRHGERLGRDFQIPIPKNGEFDPRLRAGGGSCGLRRVCDLRA